MATPRIKNLDLRPKKVSRGTKKRSNLYAAAKTSRVTGAWSPGNQSINDFIQASSPNVRARIRQLVRDYPHFSRAIDLRSRYIINTGIKYQAKIADTDGSGKITLNKPLNRRFEEEFKLFSDKKNFDIAKKLSFDAMSQLACRQDGENGEWIIRRHIRPDRRFGICYQIFEPDFLSDFAGSSNFVKGSDISQGVEYDPETGEVYGYHFYDNITGKVFRLLPETVEHAFFTYRPGQLRGISSFAPGVILADTLKARIDNELSRSAMASQWLAFVKTPDPITRQTGMTTDDDEMNGQDRIIEELNNGIIEYLNPMEDITLSSGAPDPEGFTPFVKFILQMFSIIDGLPYELVTGDYSGMNYTTLRAKRNDFAHELKVPVARFIDQYHEPFKADFIQYGALTGALPVSLREIERRPGKYMACRWQHAGLPPIDPLKERKADTEAMKNKTDSPQNIMARNGHDIEEIYQDWKAAEEMAKEYGVDLSGINSLSTATANNPAAISPDGE